MDVMHSFNCNNGSHRRKNVISDCGWICSYNSNFNYQWLDLNCSTRISLLNTTALCMLYVNIMQTTCNFIRGYYGKLIGSKLNCEIRNKLFHCILWNDLSFFECNENGKIGILLNRLCICDYFCKSSNKYNQQTAQILWR